MEPVRPALALLLALILGFTQAGDHLDYCDGKHCPDFTRTATYEDFEERLYEQSEWMCTEFSSVSEITSACDRLKDFVKRKKADENTWPVLIRQEVNNPKYEMCWFVFPKGSLRDSDEGLVKVKTFPKASFFVKSFGGAPSLEKGQENAKELKQFLKKAGKNFDPKVSYGAGYEGFFSLLHHNEIWIAKI